MSAVAILITSKGRPGGVERRFLTLHKFLTGAQAHNCFIIGFESFLEEFSEGTERTIAIQRKSLLSNAYNILSSASKRKVAHIHIASNPSLLSALITFLAPFRNIKVSVSSVNSSRTELRDFTRLSAFAHRVTYLFCKKVDFLSEDIMLNHRLLFGVDIGKSCVAPCSFLSNDSVVSDSNERVYELCFVSRLVPKKGLDLLMGALSEIDKPLRVKICGDGPLKSFISERKRDLSQHTIEFGYCDNPIKIMSKSLIFLSLQEKNNYPSQSLLEAMKAKCAIIATDVGETRKILSEQNSLLISCQADLVDGVKLLLSDAKKREGMTANFDAVFDLHNVERFSEYFLHEIVGIDS